MKKYIFFSFFFFLFVLTGCSNKTLHCTKEDVSNEDLKMVNRLETRFSGDKVTNVKSTMEVEASGIYTKHIDTLKSTLEEQFTDVKEKKGVHFTSKVKGKTITVVLDMNMKQMDAETLEEFNIVKTSEKYEDAKKRLEKDGYTCK